MQRSIHALVGRISLAIMAVTALSLVSVNGFAQLGPMFKNAPHLTASDIAVIRKVVREELTGKPNGTTLPWRNPETQRYGTVTLIDKFTSQGRDCRKVRYLINPGPHAEIRTTYELTSCRFADGTWKIDNTAKPDQSR